MQQRRVRQVVVLVAAAGLLALGAWGWRLSRQVVWQLLGLDPATGNVAWVEPLMAVGDGAVVAAPLVHDGRVFGKLISRTAENRFQWELRAFDASSGRQLWRFTPEPTMVPVVAESAAISDHGRHPPSVAAASVVFRYPIQDRVTVAVLDVATGGLRWNLETPWEAFNPTSPGMMVDPQRVVLVAEDPAGATSVQAYGMDDGSSLWQTDLPLEAQDFRTGATRGPFLAASDQTVFVNTVLGTYAFDIEAGTERFRLDRNFAEGPGRIRQIVLDPEGDTLYRLGFESIEAVDAASGRVRWQYQTPCEEDGGFGRMVPDADRLYLTCSRSGESRSWLLALDASSSQLLWKTRIDADWMTAWNTVPHADSERVYVRSDLPHSNALVAVSATDGTPRWDFVGDLSFLTSGGFVGERVYVFDRSRRWRGWIARVNPAWYETGQR